MHLASRRIEHRTGEGPADNRRDDIQAEELDWVLAEQRPGRQCFGGMVRFVQMP